MERDVEPDDDRTLTLGRLALMVAVCLVWWVALFYAVPILFAAATS